MEQLNKVAEILSEISPNYQGEEQTNLVGDGVLDSLSIMTLCAELADEFDIDITPMDIVPENFNSAKAIASMVVRLQDED